MKNKKINKKFNLKSYIKFNAVAFAVFASVLLSYVYTCNNSLPDEIRIYKGSQIKFDTFFDLSADSKQKINAVNENKSADNGKSYNVSLKIFGAVPVKNVRVDEIEEMQVVVSGKPFGIKIFTNGVMVVGMTDVSTEKGKVNPAYESGIRVGDVIRSLGDEAVQSNEDVAFVIEQSKGRSIEAKITRDGKNYSFKIKPAISSDDGKYKAGIWVRDSSAGIGTMTFYEPVNHYFAGLGHAICDVDTGITLPLESGEIVGARINSIVKSEQGSAGELCGMFTDEKLGNLFTNCNSGLFGQMDGEYKNEKLTKIATKNEVKTGKAQIYTTIDNAGPQYYDCVIEKTDYSDKAEHNMIIKITDEKLNSRTGGIVQGMSGSPILQNGCLVGALTHVFLNDSDKGYAIFAENMFYQMKSTYNEKNKN